MKRLLILCMSILFIAAQISEKQFIFTHSIYNATIPENARGKIFVEGDGISSQKMGVFIPRNGGTVRFKIVQGDSLHHFKTLTRIVGDFAFLLIRIHSQTDVTLNRELKGHYQFLVKATFRLRGKRNLETTAVVNLRIRDQNDLTPLFLPSDYVVEFGDHTKMFTELTQVFASDADSGLNGQVYYSLMEPNSHLAIHPVSGKLILLRPLTPGRYSLLVRAEDRASRLFHDPTIRFGSGRTPSQATVTLSVVRTNLFPPTITAELKPIDVNNWTRKQLAAILRITDDDDHRIAQVLIERNDLAAYLFVLRVENGVYLLETLPGFPLTFDEEPNVNVLAIDDGIPPKNTTKTIAIRTIESNEVTLNQSEFTFVIGESAPIDSILGFATVNCAGPVKYFLVDSGHPFQIDPRTGLLSLGKSLDYENMNRYEFMATADIATKKHQLSVIVHVDDDNDNSPQFDIKWKEGLPISVDRQSLSLEDTICVIGAFDEDSGDNGRLSFRLANEQMTPFLIDYYTGELKLRSPLPHDENAWKLLIRTSDFGRRPLPRESELTLWIYDKNAQVPGNLSRPIRFIIPNENSPKFAQNLYEISTFEDAVVGSVLARLSATDSDWGYAASIVYVLLRNGNELGHFSIDTYSGDVFILKPFSKPGIFDLIIQAIDQGSPQLSSTAKVRLIVVDVNNHWPQFQRPIYRATIGEDVPIGRQVLQVSAADDDDEGDNARIRYRLSTRTNDFYLDASTGILTNVRQLDRETVAEHRLVVVAYDLGHPSLSTSVNVTLLVVDVNDNAPECVQKIHQVQVLEDWPQGALLTCIGAVDRDDGANARLTFELDSTRNNGDLPFRMDAHSGCLFVDSERPLNFEQRPLYNFTVEVSDNGQPQFSVVCPLLVELIDVDENQHPPIFYDFVHEASVYENEPIGTEVTTIKASDPDDPSNPVQYTIVDGDGRGLFSIDGQGTIRSTVVFDRETSTHHWLTISGRDTAPVARWSFLHVLVRVDDRNDFAPRPRQPIYAASVLENSPEHTIVVKVEADDPDDPFASLNYRISHGDPQSFFAIDSHTGYITTQGRRLLDRETQQEHELEVSISDDGQPPLSTTVVVVVTVTDLNDNPPVFKRPIYHFDVPSVQQHSSLCRVFAADADQHSNAHITYRITEDVADLFAIDDQGSISTGHKLQPGTSFALTISASDSGQPRLSSSTRVMLTVAEDRAKTAVANQPPATDHWSELHLSDADSVGETIGLLDAEDPDGDRLWWSIIDGNSNGTFSLRNDTGELQLARSLQFVELKKFQLIYMITDGIDRVQAKVTVHVSRAIPRRPRFISNNYVFSVSETAPLGTLIGMLRAELGNDEEWTNRNRQISYSLHSVDSPISAEKFQVDARTGRVVLVESLNHETQKEHLLTIAARYGSLVNLTTFLIKVTDDNDHAPQFDLDYYEARVFATAAVHTSILAIHAHDSDSGLNSIVAYSIGSGNELGMFSLNSATGQISVAKRLSPDYPETVLAVKATDGGSVSKSTTCTVRILTVMDEISPPRFLRDPYLVSVPENQPVGTHIATVYAESAAGVRYEMHISNANFNIHPASGAVFLARKLDRELSEWHNMSVLAQGSMGGVSATTIRVEVVDVNDHAPVFIEPNCRGSIQENMVAGNSILMDDGRPLTVTATDKDKGPNGAVNYQIDTPWVNEYLTVDIGTGIVRTRKPLDFEHVSILHFSILAHDLGSPSRTSSLPAWITVSVIDANDQLPVFESRKFDMTLMLPTVEGAILGSIRAKDGDSVGRLKYAIGNGKMSRLFAIDEDAGTVTVRTGNNSMFTDSQYAIPISVYDGLHSVHSSISLSVLPQLPVNSNSSLHFSLPSYQVSVVENITTVHPLTILTFTVIDAKLGDRILYRLLNPTAGFAISANSGELMTIGMALDREITSKLDLLVQATDGIRTARTLVTVTVQDVNDCAPKFLELPYYASVPLDSKVGERVVQVKAIDDDNGLNGQIRYSLIDSANGRFDIDSWDGRISVAGPFHSSQKQQHYSLVVEATDQGEPTLKSSESVEVTVVNRAMPIFDRRFYTSAVDEDAESGTIVLVVNAESNVGGKLGYFIKDGDNDDHFLVDFHTGAVLTRKSLDREEMSEFNLTLVAVDVGRDDLLAYVQVQVTILDVNDNRPIFTPKSVHISAPESMPVGSIVHQLKAIDKDSGDSGKVFYRLKNAADETFQLDENTGDLMVKKALDFETTTNYKFTVVATDAGDPPLSSECQISLSVIDVNDQCPLFEKSHITAFLPDDSLRGHFVTKLEVIDPDTVSNFDHPLLYSILNDSMPPLLEIGRYSGLIRLARVVEEGDIIFRNRTYNVSVSDGLFTSTAFLHLELTPSTLRSESLHFEQNLYSPGVKENEPIGTPVVTVFASGGGAPLKFGFGGKDESLWPVEIDQQTGKVFTRSVLDFETQQEYEIPLVVEDANGRKNFAKLSLNVLDRNDHTPVFVARQYSATVSANASRGETVLRVNAIDPDGNDQVEYSMFDRDWDDDNLWQFFKLHKRRGVLSVRRELHTLNGKKLNFFLRATDRGNPPKQTEVAVEVSVLDGDIIVPRFSDQHYHFSIDEDGPLGTKVGQLRQDESFGISTVHYLLVPSPNADFDSDFPFDLHRLNGSIAVIKLLDREFRGHWQFAVSINTKWTSRMSTVSIRVNDVNDNPPRFTSNYRQLAVTEDALIGSSVTVFSTTDPDLAISGKVVYSLQDLDADIGAFRVDAESGRLLVDGPLDRETKATYRMVVKATDHGQLSTTAPVSIRLIDANDNSPEFSKAVYRFALSESAQLGTIFGHVTVTDADWSPNNNSQLSIIDGNEHGLFAIKDTGDLFVKKSLDFDRITDHNLEILANDGRHSTTTMAIVIIERMNNQPPTCEMDRVDLTVREDARIGEEVFLMIVDDEHVGEFLTFILINSLDDSFALNKNGMLLIGRSLDREKIERYELEIRAIDVQGRHCTTRVNIRISDVNDEQPVFEKSIYEIGVKENIHTDKERHFLIKVTAFDNDQGLSGKVRYLLESSDDPEIEEYFKISEYTGALTLMRSLDSELRSAYNVTVLAMDMDPNEPKSSKACVLVNVVDMNDNAPIFERKMYTVKLAEDEPVGHEILQVHAIGGDRGEIVKYRLIGQKSVPNHFEVDENTGSIKLVEMVDFEQDAQFVLTIEAIDSGRPPLTSSSTVEITVLDVNDNSPKFGSNFYKAKVDENSPIGTKIFQFAAQDADSGDFGKISYSLAIPNERFSIVADWLVVQGELNRETMSIHQLQIIASDGAFPPLTDRAKVTVTVADRNDNAPQFSDCNMTVVVQETVEIGRQLLTLSLFDRDAPPNGRPFQVVIRGDDANHFTMVGLTVTTAAKLIHSVKSLYLLTVEASDNGQPTLSSECPLTVHVTPESRHAPVLRPASVHVNCLMGEFPGALVARATAEDKDENDILRYQLAGHLRHFTIDSETGDLVALHGLPGGVHKVNVTVTDGKFTSSAIFSIEMFPIDQSALDHSVSIRFSRLRPEEFLSGPKRQFEKIVSRSIGGRLKNVHILSVQSAVQSSQTTAKDNDKNRHRKRRRGRGRKSRRHQRRTTMAVEDLDVLFTVYKSKSRGYYRPTFVRHKLEEHIGDLDRHGQLNVVFLGTEMCRRDLCIRGDCRDRLWLDDADFRTILTLTTVLVTPKHVRTFECLCNDGFGGARCAVPVNACSRNPCTNSSNSGGITAIGTICMPRENPIGYQCVCPPGMTGDNCHQKQQCPSDDDDEDDCSRMTAVQLSGSGYLRYTLSNPLDRRLELAVELRTGVDYGVVFYDRGVNDFHSLEIHDGRLTYRWDCGAGQAAVTLRQVRVADGSWHLVKVSRRGRHVKLAMDESFFAENSSSLGNDVINFQKNAGKLTFGGRVDDHPTLYGHKQIARGFHGCLNRIFIDGFELPKSKQGLSMYNVEMNCHSTFIASVCNSNPCRNLGSCSAIGDDYYSCNCLPRFTGSNCEIDLNPCAGNRCPNGSTCQSVFNDFFCRCPPGLTGNNCHLSGDFDECSSSPCGFDGKCTSLSGVYVCTCTDGRTGRTCVNSLPFSVVELGVAIGAVLLLLLLLCAIVCLCRRTERYRHYRKTPYLPNDNDELMLEAHGLNPAATRGGFDGKFVDIPPPLPPRGTRTEFRNKLSNFQSAQLTGLPTVQVRPLSIHDRMGVCNNCSSSSPAGSHRCHPHHHHHHAMSCNDSDITTSVSCRRPTTRNEANWTANYGSAAEDLEKFGRFQPDASRVLGTFTRPADRGHATGDIFDRQQLLDGLDRMSEDTLERLKCNNVDDEDKNGSLTSSIQCLSMDDHANAHLWGNSDWTSTINHDEVADLPPGISALEDTDAEFFDDDDDNNDHSLVEMLPLAPGDNFRKELLKLQQLTRQVYDSDNTSGNDAVSCDEYVTMKPMVHRRDPMGSCCTHDASEDTDAQDCIQYGFPRTATPDRTQVVYEQPPNDDCASRVSSFKEHGTSVSDLSGLDGQKHTVV